MSLNLPHGPATRWDMTKLTMEQLDYERELCHQVLYGYVSKEHEGVFLSGLLSEEHPLRGYYSPCIVDDAVATWKLRLKRAEDELFERGVLCG